MQWIFSTLKLTLSRALLVFGLVSLISLGSLLFVMIEPSLAAVSNSQPAQEKLSNNKVTPTAQNREAAYEEAVEAAKSPEGLEKEYEKNLEVYEDKQPNQNLVEGAKNLLDKVTNNE